LRSGDSYVDRFLIANIDGDRRYLTDIAGCLQKQGPVRAPHSHPNETAVMGELFDDIAANESGAANDGND
jgi:hypothetical protein